MIVGIDNGGTKNNVTVLDESGSFLVDRMVEVPSRVTEGTAPPRSMRWPAAFDTGLTMTGIDRADVRAVGLDTPGPASADGVISSKGATNFAAAGVVGLRRPRRAGEAARAAGRVQQRRQRRCAVRAPRLLTAIALARRSSVSAIVGTGLGGGVIEPGRVVRGAAGHGRRARPRAHPDGRSARRRVSRCRECNCGFVGDVESVASLTGIRNNLLPYWLTRYPDHELTPAADRGRGEGAARLRRARRRDGAARSSSSRRSAIGRLFTIAANFTDPDTYFVGGGVVEAAPEFRDWYLVAGARQHPRCAPSSSTSPSSRWCPTSTWPAHAAPRSRHAAPT